jgi:hypothetical protein
MTIDTVELALPSRKRRSGSSRVGRLPRVTRLMALAIKSNQLIREGVARDYADLARLVNVSPARVTQIMNLLHLAPDIQEKLLFFEPVLAPRRSINERRIRPVTKLLDWKAQRELLTQIAPKE